MVAFTVSLTTLVPARAIRSTPPDEYQPATSFAAVEPAPTLPPASVQPPQSVVTVQPEKQQVRGRVATVRPGPDLLYAAPTRAPQLESVGIWKAQPTLVSGTTAYRSHEFLYQDHVYDDLGAGNEVTYPTDVARFANNAADLVELRLKQVPEGLAVRLTYNTMVDPDVVATTLALGGSSDRKHQMPHSSYGEAPGDVFVTVHGATADAVRAGSGEKLQSRFDVSVDRERRQVTIVVPPAVFTPLRTFRVAAATGLWDTRSATYRVPRHRADATHPGGPAGTPCAFLNAAFRFDEHGPWASGRQAKALSACDLSPFHAVVDLQKLTGADDDLSGSPQGVPRTGRMTRIYASRFDNGQGRPATDHLDCEKPCNTPPYLAGQLQPYAVHVPDRPTPPGGFGLTLSLHSCTASLHGPAPVTEELARRGEGSIVLMPEGRGPCSWYWSQSAADVFEAWADVMRHHRLDLSKSVITGMSMGGYGSYKLASQYPDLFSAILPDIACSSAGVSRGAPRTAAGGEASAVKHIVPSLRHVHVLSANASNDSLCPTWSQQEIRDVLEAQGHRYDWRVYAGTHAPYFPTPDEAAAYFLQHPKAAKDPARVTYAYNEAMDERTWLLNADHAYWISDVRLRDRTVASRTGVVDVRSLGFGAADPTPSPVGRSAGRSGPWAYTGQSRTWGPAAPAPKADVLEIKATNIADVTIDATRARVSCGANLKIVSDGPLTVRWINCPTA